MAQYKNMVLTTNNCITYHTIIFTWQIETMAKMIELRKRSANCFLKSGQSFKRSTIVIMTLVMYSRQFSR